MGSKSVGLGHRVSEAALKAFPKFSKPLTVTQWQNHGDHSRVERFSAREIAELRLPEWGNRLGIIRSNPPVLVRPTDWIIEDGKSVKKLSESQFRREFELIEDVV